MLKPIMLFQYLMLFIVYPVIAWQYALWKEPEAMISAMLLVFHDSRDACAMDHCR